MGSRVRQVRQLLGLATATALCALLSGAAAGDSSGQNVSLEPSKPEFRLVRLIYTDNAIGYGHRGFGMPSWTTDSPEAEYHLSQGIRRLTRINTIDPDRDQVVYPVQPLDDDLFNYPFLYAVEVGRWYLNDEEAARIRDYLLRGGFLMVDDFHGTEQWEYFMDSMRRVFPDREVVEIPDSHEVFHVVWDLDQKVQIPGSAALMRGVTYEYEGTVPHWRGIFDDRGRLMVAINFNMDLGDSWELADQPDYPERYTALGYRFGISYALYAMTH